jgi:hypothetical protein
MLKPIKREEHPMWSHINASLEEKIKTLKNNSFRFYVSENVWVPRQNRIGILDRFLEEAIYDENYELCRTIHELKLFLSAVYDKENSYYKILLFTTFETINELEIKFFLIKSENSFKVYSEVNDSNELYDHKVSIECIERLSVTEINELLIKLFRYNDLFYGYPIYVSNGLLDFEDYQIIFNQLSKIDKVI